MFKEFLKDCGVITIRSALGAVVTIGTMAIIGELSNIKEKSENSKEDKKEEK